MVGGAGMLRSDQKGYQGSKRLRNTDLDFITRRYCKWTKINYPNPNPNRNLSPNVIKCRVIKYLRIKCLYTILIGKKKRIHCL